MRPKFQPQTLATKPLFPMIITYNFLNVGQTGYEGTVENLSVNSAIMHRVNVCGRGGGPFTDFFQWRKRREEEGNHVCLPQILLYTEPVICTTAPGCFSFLAVHMHTTLVTWPRPMLPHASGCTVNWPAAFVYPSFQDKIQDRKTFLGVFQYGNRKQKSTMWTVPLSLNITHWCIGDSRCIGGSLPCLEFQSTWDQQWMKQIFWQEAQKEERKK